VLPLPRELPWVLASWGIAWLVLEWPHLAGRARRLAPLVPGLYLYGLSTRAVVAVVVTGATLLGLGTHYDLSALTRVVDPLTGAELRFEGGSATQALRLGVGPQLLFWPLYTVAAGLAGTAVASALGPIRSLFRLTRP